MEDPSNMSLAATPDEDNEQASSTATEITPLLLAPSTASAPATTTPASAPPTGSGETRSRTGRTVTFNPNPVTKTFSPDAEFPHRPKTSHFSPTPSGASSSTPGLLRGNLRRRNSHGSVPIASAVGHLPKIGPQRSTKNAQKLKLLPNPDFGEDGPDEESGRDVYSQYTRIKDPTARRDAARLGKADRDRLPRVTAYCTANRYNLEGLMRSLKGKGKTKGANPKLIDECIYTPYTYESEQSRERRLEVRQDSGFASQADPDPVHAYERRHSTGSDATTGFRRDEMMQMGQGQDEYGNGYSDEQLLDESALLDNNAPDFDIHIHTPEIFLFDYGVVVIWGMSTAQETRFLKEISRFELERLPPDQVETEFFNFYYTREYQPRIYNDFITLRDKYNYMTKLAISHALAQSVKTSLFEESIATTIETCKEIPEQIARTGKISLSRTQINMQIGELFILRINIHLNGSVLDTPELFWVEPQLEPVYQAVRSYLEMDQRVGLLTDRMDVIADLLAVLKDQLSHGHGEKLEWIVIILIAAEICVAAVNIVVDLYAGV